MQNTGWSEGFLREAAGDAEADELLALFAEDDALLTSPSRVRMVPAGRSSMEFVQVAGDPYGGAQRLTFRLESVLGDRRVRVGVEDGFVREGAFVPEDLMVSFVLPVVLWEYLRQFTVSPEGEFELQRPWMASSSASESAFIRAYPFLRPTPTDNSVTSPPVSGRKNVGSRYS